MRQIILNEEEARAIVQVLKGSWMPLDLQKMMYDLITRIEKELED